jgi:hypothetical protein
MYRQVGGDSDAKSDVYNAMWNRPLYRCASWWLSSGSLISNNILDGRPTVISIYIYIDIYIYIYIYIYPNLLLCLIGSKEKRV